ncbi:hypothetical protein MKR81_26875 (plasmid) [Vibrio campbellii]|uniref:hypothetical protein n=1 Tax=Vibrio campbellii TaxID=680 RepID=UPI001F07613B|nr:hypothetical protein [Vibrio campbellii]UMM06574.1 hypothetical protein MKR81_26875 [Vibrio campbellii]
MKRFVLAALITSVLVPVSAAELSLQGEGVYRIGEFDSLHSAKGIAEQHALVDMARKAKERVLSLQNIDKNGYYTRVSWLVNSSLLSKEVVSDDVAVCSDGIGQCVTVKLKGVLDTSQSEKHLHLLYSDVKLTQKLELLIEKEAERERLILAGESVDYADAKERQHKRKQILDYLSGRVNKKNAGLIDPSLIKTFQEATVERQGADLSIGTSYLEYQSLLNSVKRELSVTIEDQEAIIHEDGSGGIRLKLSLNSPNLGQATNWVAEKLGVPKGDWIRHRDHSRSKYGKAWVYGVVEDRSLGDAVTESVVVGEQTGLVIEADRYLIQYGINSDGIRQHKNDNPDYRLDRDKLHLINELGKAKVCIEFSLGKQKPVEKCIVGGEQNSDGDYVNSAWDINAPYLWYAKDGAVFNLFLPIAKETLRDPALMRNLNFQYQVTVTAKSLGM